MGPSRRTRLKICCIASAEEAGLAVEAGADAVGLVGAMPSGPGPIEDAAIAAIARQVPPPCVAVLLTAAVQADTIAEQADAAAVPMVQIVNHVDPGIYPRLRACLPGRRLLQVVHVQDRSAIDRARSYAALADALLLDSGRPGAAIAELGGTGRVHDWRISRQIATEADLPVILAGGLDPDNVGAAIATVRPFAVDVCSGVRSRGRLDPDKLAAFAAAVAEASRNPDPMS